MNIIIPIKDKNGNVRTNVQIVKAMHKTLSALKNPPLGLDKSERERRQLLFSKICGGPTNSQEVYNWLEQIVKCTDEIEGQRLIGQTLLSIKE